MNEKIWAVLGTVPLVLSSVYNSPKVLAINHMHRRRRCIEVVKQARIDADAPGLAVPAFVGLEIRAVTEGAAAAVGAEVMRHHL